MVDDSDEQGYGSYKSTLTIFLYGIHPTKVALR